MKNYTKMANHKSQLTVAAKLLAALFVGIFLLTPKISNAITYEDHLQLKDDPEWIKTRPNTEKFRAGEAPLTFEKLLTHVRHFPDGVKHEYRQAIVHGKDAFIQSEARQDLVFNPSFQKLIVHFMGVHRNGQSIDYKEQVKPTIFPVRSDLPGIYTSQVQARFEIPNVQPQDAIELRFSVVGRNPVFGSHSWSLEPWQITTLPVAERVHEVSWHDSKPVQVEILKSRGTNRWLESEQARMTRTTTEGWTTVRYSGSGIRPGHFDERQAPGGPQTDMIQASTFANWTEVENWGRQFFKTDKSPQSPAFDDLLLELKKNQTPEQQALAALRWVQREIRYVSLSLGENSHTPYSPDEVIARRFGDCKDKTLLLLHLLRRLGIESQPALMFLMDPQTPRLAIASTLFDHAVVVVWIGGKKYVFDGTLGEQVSDLAHLTPWHAGADLLILDGPQSGLREAPSSAAAGASRVTVSEVMQISANGDSGVLSTEISLEGDEADQTRWDLTRNGSGIIKERYLKDIRRAYPSANWATEPNAEDHPATNKIVLRGQVKINRPLKKTPGNLQRYGYRIDTLLNKLPIRGGLGRVTDLAISPFKSEILFKHKLILPDNWLHQEESYEEKVSHELFEFQMERRTINSKNIEDEWRLKLRSDRVLRKNLDSYLQAVKAVEDLPTEVRLRAP